MRVYAAGQVVIRPGMERAWISVAVRFTGLVMVAVSLPPVGHVANRIVTSFFMGNGLAFLSLAIDHGQDDPGNWVGWMGLLVLGLYLFLRGRWVARHLARPFDRRCPSCGYDLHGTRGVRCPECGGPIYGAGPSETSGSNRGT